LVDFNSQGDSENYGLGLSKWSGILVLHSAWTSVYSWQSKISEEALNGRGLSGIDFPGPRVPLAIVRARSRPRQTTIEKAHAPEAINDHWSQLVLKA